MEETVSLPIVLFNGTLSPGLTRTFSLQLQDSAQGKK